MNTIGPDFIVDRKVKAMLSKNKTKKKRKYDRPFLNFCKEDDLIYFGDMDCFASDDDKDEPSFISEHDFFPPSFQGRNTLRMIHDELQQYHNAPQNQHSELDLLKEDDDYFSAFATSENGDSCIVSVCLDNDDVSDWDIVTESKSEWDILSVGDAKSVDSFDFVQSFHALSYKDALLKIATPNYPMKDRMGIARGLLPDKNLERGTKTQRKSIIRPILEENEEDTSFDAFFDYDGYKGARGGKPAFKSERESN